MVIFWTLLDDSARLWFCYAFFKKNGPLSSDVAAHPSKIHYKMCLTTGIWTWWTLLECFKHLGGSGFFIRIFETVQLISSQWRTHHKFIKKFVRQYVLRLVGHFWRIFDTGWILDEIIPVYDLGRIGQAQQQCI